MRLIIDGIEFGYSSTPVLKDITLDANGPQLLSIIGPNGVGKSTLIHCINRILSPNKGTVMIDGDMVNDISLKDLAKKVGYVPYSANDTFPLSVVDTVLMGRHPHATYKSLDKDLDIVYDTLRLLNIEDLALRNFNELSAGQNQKVMLARGLVQEPEILLLDEPFAGIDPKAVFEIKQIVRSLARLGIGILLTDHNVRDALSITTCSHIISDGNILVSGGKQELLANEIARDIYFGESFEEQ